MTMRLHTPASHHVSQVRVPSDTIQLSEFIKSELPLIKNSNHIPIHSWNVKIYNILESIIYML